VFSVDTVLIIAFLEALDTGLDPDNRPGISMLAGIDADPADGLTWR
jgi:hypothetical protein